jgi:hypothetical protein
MTAPGSGAAGTIGAATAASGALSLGFDSLRQLGRSGGSPGGATLGLGFALGFLDRSALGGEAPSAPKGRSAGARGPSASCPTKTGPRSTAP